MFWRSHDWIDVDFDFWRFGIGFDIGLQMYQTDKDKAGHGLTLDILLPFIRISFCGFLSEYTLGDNNG